MKTIILSTQHKWVEKIHLKIKTDEVRKTAPGTPFKALIYDTKSSGGCGKVVSEFICDDCITVFPTMDILKNWYTYGDAYDFINACLTEMDLHIYGNGKPLRVLHISQLKIYDKPKELSEFKTVLSNKDIRCKFIEQGTNLLSGKRYNKCKLQDCACEFHHLGNQTDCVGYEQLNKIRPLKQAPQSWCYVEEI